MFGYLWFLARHSSEAAGRPGKQPGEEHLVTNVGVDGGGQTVKGFVFSTNVSAFLRRKADLWDPELLPSLVLFSINITSVVEG